MSKRRMSLEAIRWRRNQLIVAVLLKLISTALQLTTYRRVCHWLLRLSPTPEPEITRVRDAMVIARLVNITARHPAVNATCLPRSLTLWWLLRWKHIPSKIRIGVGHTEGHAWVEHHDIVINDSQNVADRYLVTYDNELTPEQIIRLV